MSSFPIYFFQRTLQKTKHMICSKQSLLALLSLLTVQTLCAQDLPATKKEKELSCIAIYAEAFGNNFAHSENEAKSNFLGRGSINALIIPSRRNANYAMPLFRLGIGADNNWKLAENKTMLLYVPLEVGVAFSRRHLITGEVSMGITTAYGEQKFYYRDALDPRYTSAPGSIYYREETIETTNRNRNYVFRLGMSYLGKEKALMVRVGLGLALPEKSGMTAGWYETERVAHYFVGFGIGYVLPAFHLLQGKSQ
jgi:hypothetical protein